MRKYIVSLALAASLSLTACEGWKVNGVDTGVNSGNDQNYCSQSAKNRQNCIIVGLLIGGGIGLALLASDDGGGGGGGQQQPQP